MSRYARYYWGGMFFLGIAALIGSIAVFTLLLPLLIVAGPFAWVGYLLFVRAEQERPDTYVPPEPQDSEPRDDDPLDRVYFK